MFSFHDTSTILVQLAQRSASANMMIWNVGDMRLWGFDRRVVVLRGLRIDEKVGFEGVSFVGAVLVRK